MNLFYFYLTPLPRCGYSTVNASDVFAPVHAGRSPVLVLGLQLHVHERAPKFVHFVRGAGLCLFLCSWWRWSSLLNLGRFCRWCCCWWWWCWWFSTSFGAAFVAAAAAAFVRAVLFAICVPLRDGRLSLGAVKGVSHGIAFIRHVTVRFHVVPQVAGLLEDGVFLEDHHWTHVHKLIRPCKRREACYLEAKKDT